MNEKELGEGSKGAELIPSSTDAIARSQIRPKRFPVAHWDCAIPPIKRPKKMMNGAADLDK